MTLFAALDIPSWATPIAFALIALYVAWVLRHSYRTGRIHLGLLVLDRRWADRGDIRGALFILWVWLAIAITGFVVSLVRAF